MSQDELPQDELSRDGLSPCKTCGEEISRNIDGVIFHGRCPKCGEKDPHGFVAETIATNKEIGRGCRDQITAFIAIIVVLLVIGFIFRDC